MADSYVEICNRALSRVGTTRLIESVAALGTGGTIEAEQCRVWYPSIRDLILRRYPWPFATRRVRLAEIVSDRTDWSHVYAAPPAMLFARYVVEPSLRNPRADQRPAHRIEAAVDDAGEVIGKLILTDQVDAELVYTPRVTNPVVFDPDFEDAYVWRLAAELALSLKVNDYASVGRVCLNAFEAAVRQAAATAFNEEAQEQEPTSSFEASRS
jgi:hypothetical protein